MPTLAEIEAQIGKGLGGAAVPPAAPSDLDARIGESLGSGPYLVETREGALNEALGREALRKNLPWGPWTNMLDAALLGHGAKILAPTSQSRQPPGAKEPLTQAQIDRANDIARAKQAELEGARRTWQGMEPGQALVTDLMGSTAPMAPLMAAGGAGAGAALARAPRAIQAAGEFLGGTAGDFNSLTGTLTRLGSRAAAGGIQGAISGAAMSGLSDAPLESQIAMGTGVGALLNAGAGAITGPLGSRISPQIARLVYGLDEHGVPVRTGEIPGAPYLARKLDTLFGPERDPTQWNRALAQTMGTNSDVINQAAVDRAKAQAGRTLNRAARTSGINATDPDLITGLRNIDTQASRNLNVSNPSAYEQYSRLHQMITDELAYGHISGDLYKSLTQRGSALDQAMARTSPIRHYAIQLKTQLDNALERSNPAEAKAIAQARHHWHNASILEDLADETTQTVDPQALLRKVESGRASSGYGSSARASAAATRVGADADIGTLAEGGANVLTQPAQRMRHSPLSVGGAAAAGGMAVIGAEHALPYLARAWEHGGLTGLAVPAAAIGGAGAAAYGTHALMSQPWYRNMLLDRALGMRGGAFGGTNPLIPPATYMYNQPEAQQ